MHFLTNEHIGVPTRTCNKITSDHDSHGEVTAFHAQVDRTDGSGDICDAQFQAQQRLDRRFHHLEVSEIEFVNGSGHGFQDDDDVLACHSCFVLVA